MQVAAQPLRNDPFILQDTWFSDEDVFNLSGKSKRHNTRIWETEILRLSWGKSVIDLSLLCSLDLH